MGLGTILMAAAVPAGAQVIGPDDRPAEDQISRLYQAVFGRSADAEGFSFWTERYRTDGSLEAIAAAFAASPEFIDRYGLDPTDEALVDAMYDNVLGRDGDADGVRYWREQLASGAVSQLGLLLAFADSTENIERTDTSQPLTSREAQLLRLYRSAFGRFPDSGGFAFWMGEYTESTPLRDIALRFAQSPEFTEIYGESPRPSELVDRLYRNVLSREGDAEGMAFWETEYRLGRSLPEMLVAFADSAENLQRTGTASNPARLAATPASLSSGDVFAMSLPAGACGGIGGPAGVILDESPPSPGSNGERIVYVSANYTDLDADGATDVVVELQCEGDGNAIWSDAVVWIAGQQPRCSSSTSTWSSASKGSSSSTRLAPVRRSVLVSCESSGRGSRRAMLGAVHGRGSPPRSRWLPDRSW